MVIVGSGFLAGVIVDALLQDLLPGYDLVGIYARTPAKAKELTHRMQENGRTCTVCSSLDALLALLHFKSSHAALQVISDIF